MIYKHTFVLSALFIFALVVTPSHASAATKRPSCELTVTTSAGKETIRNKAEVLVREGEDITIAWESDNAKKGTDKGGDSIPLSGSVTESPSRDTKYSYSFTGTGSSRKAKCEVRVQVAEGTISTSSLTTTNSKPTLSGDASGTKTVQVVIRKEGSTKPVFTSKHVKVKRGEWEVKTTKTLPDGTYTVELLAEKKWELNTLDEATLAVGESSTPSSASTTGASTLTVSTVPLLFGGTATRGTSVPVAYLQIKNTGKVATSLTGVTLKQNGSAPLSAITSLEVRDDKGISRGITAAKPAANGTLFASADAVIEPGQVRLFTVRTTVSPAAFAGTQLMLDVQSISTNSKATGQFPLRGTTYTIR